MSRREVGAHDLDADLPLSSLFYMLAVFLAMIAVAGFVVYFVWF